MTTDDDRDDVSDDGGGRGAGRASDGRGQTPASDGMPQEAARTKPTVATTDADEEQTEAAASQRRSLPLKMPIQLEPPRRAGSIGRMETYEILNVVGRGGMGIVARAFDEQLHRNVAIKVMSDQLITSERARKRFLREARAAASINHPNVVTIHAVSEKDGTPYLVMEYVDGQALQSRIQKDAPMSYEDVLRIGSQIASGLAAAHRHGIVHRDIKPGNVMLEDGIERVKLTDFGLARLLVENSDLTSFGDMVGTPAYMSPEQVNGDELSPASDLFSLGCVLYAMFLGKSPFHASTSFSSANRVKDFDPKPISSFVEGVPREFDQLIRRLLAKNPKDRPETAEEVASALLRWSAEAHQRRLPGGSPLKGAAPSADKKPIGPLRLLAGAVAVASLVSAAVFFKPNTAKTISTPITADNALDDGILVVHAGEGEFATLRAAIAAAQPGTTIQLLPGTYQGPFELSDDVRLKGLRIVGQEGVTLVGPAGAAVLRIANVSDCEIRELTIETGVLQNGLNVSGACAGLSIRSVYFVAKQPEQTQVGCVRFDLGASGTPDAPIEVTECNFDAGAVGLVIGSHDPSEEPVKHVRVHHNHIRAASIAYGIPVVVQGRVSDIEIERNILRRGLGGFSINLRFVDGADGVVFRYNTLAQIDIAFFLNDSIMDQDVRIEKNLVVEGRTLHTITGSPAQYDMWFSGNQWVANPELDQALVESMFALIPASSVRSLDADSPEFLKPSEQAAAELAGFYGTSN